ncbi:uncharacterized protein B0P05DRAFT_481849, partial [Gilbertella persicaria]|uniref:uncharacterized protein n=1 Tax=Gilbertella persicaria TaxID=101096 RepID=UPI00221FAA08
ERLAQLESLVAENSALKKELAAARSRILELESQAGSSAASPLDAKITPKQRKAAARIFLVSSPAAAGTCVDRPLYEYVYLPNKYRDRLSAFRRKLRLIGLDNSRVLDVHYPARNVVALLIHSAYKEDLLKVMAKYSLPVLTDFDPFSGTNVKDPAFASLDANTLSAKARELQQAVVYTALSIPSYTSYALKEQVLISCINISFNHSFIRSFDGCLPS